MEKEKLMNNIILEYEFASRSRTAEAGEYGASSTSIQISRGVINMKEFPIIHPPHEKKKKLLNVFVSDVV